MPKLRGYQDFLVPCGEFAGMDVGQGELRTDLAEMFMVANVVRHLKGSPCKWLKSIAPALWDDAANNYHDLMVGPPIPSEHLRIRTGER